MWVRKWDTESEVREATECSNKKRRKAGWNKGVGEVGKWERKTSKTKIPVSFQFSILLGRFACVIPQHVFSTSGAVEDCGCDSRGRRWKDRYSERYVGDGRGWDWGLRAQREEKSIYLDFSRLALLSRKTLFAFLHVRFFHVCLSSHTQTHTYRFKDLFLKTWTSFFSYILAFSSFFYCNYCVVFMNHPNVRNCNCTLNDLMRSTDSDAESVILLWYQMDQSAFLSSRILSACTWPGLTLSRVKLIWPFYLTARPMIYFTKCRHIF